MARGAWVSEAVPCVVFAANRGYALTSSRLSLIRRFLAHGWTVVAATTNDADGQALRQMGVHLEPVPFARGGLSPAVDLDAYRRLASVYRRWRPHLVHHFHAKPLMLGTLAARRALGKAVRVVNSITGLGHAFVVGGLSARLAAVGYRAALRRCDVVIFQNRDDRELFLEKRWVVGEQARLIASSGVDTERFGCVDRAGRDRQTPKVVMLGRLLRQKGIPEFVEVARRVRRRWPEARFLLAGEPDADHPDAVDAAWLSGQQDIEYLGRLSDVMPLLAEADLLLFPSFYREGVPRVVLEAAATGLPAVAFDVPGVREAIRDKETGYLVPARNLEALTDRVTSLLEDVSRRLRMGRAARALAESAFDARIIEGQHLQVYRSLGLPVD